MRFFSLRSHAPIGIVSNFCIPLGGIIILPVKEIISMANTIRIAIDGMHCEACVRRVTNALAGVEGVKVDSVQVGAAKVTFDPAVTAPEQVAAAVDRIGFTAHVER